MCTGVPFVAQEIDSTKTGAVKHWSTKVSDTLTWSWPQFNDEQKTLHMGANTTTVKQEERGKEGYLSINKERWNERRDGRMMEEGGSGQQKGKNER